jgi:hypothetical protein
VKVDIQQRFRSGKLEDFPVLVEPVKAALPQVRQMRLEQIAQPILAGVGHGKQHVPARAGLPGQDAFGDLVHAVLADLGAALGAVGDAGASIEQPQKIVDSVAVATVERGFFVEFFCRIATAGATPMISSTSGFSMRSRNCRA